MLNKYNFVDLSFINPSFTELLIKKSFLRPNADRVRGLRVFAVQAQRRTSKKIENSIYNNTIFIKILIVKNYKMKLKYCKYIKVKKQ
jgi:hypothetical protein